MEAPDRDQPTDLLSVTERYCNKVNELFIVKVKNRQHDVFVIFTAPGSKKSRTDVNRIRLTDGNNALVLLLYDSYYLKYKYIGVYSPGLHLVHGFNVTSSVADTESTGNS